MDVLSASDLTHCTEIVRRLDRDLYLANLFLPEQYRAPVLVLQAFYLTIADIGNQVREPMPGEIRLQWWRDVVSGGRKSEAAGNPLSHSLRSVVETYALPHEALATMIDACAINLYQDPMPDIHSLEAYSGETFGLLFQLSCQVIAGKPVPEAADACGHGGVVRTIVSILSRLPRHRQRRQCFIPADILKRSGYGEAEYFAGEQSAKSKAATTALNELAQSHLAKCHQSSLSLSPDLLPLFLSLAISEKWLDRMENSGLNLMQVTPSYPQWQRQIVLWKSARKGTF